MSERNHDYLETLGRKRRVVAGSFLPNDASAIDNDENLGDDFTVVYSATGVYTVTLAEKYVTRHFATAHCVQAARAQEVEVASYDPQTGVLVINSFESGTQTPEYVDAAAGTRVEFMLVCSDALTN